MPWYLFGAQAALVYGSPRLTADIDITVELGSVATEALLAALVKRGFEPRFDDSEFVATTRVLPVVHQATGLPADVVLGGPGLEELFLSRSVMIDVGGVEVPVASAEDLIAMKLLSGREKDLADVRAILRARNGTLNIDMVRTTLTMLEEALGQSDLTPLLARVLAEVG